jgi:hypothetical protein
MDEFMIYRGTSLAQGASSYAVELAPFPSYTFIPGTTNTTFTFAVTRANSIGTSSVDYSVIGATDGTHSAASANDFAGGVFPSGTVTFLDGENTKTLSFDVIGDSIVEADERFNVVLSNPVNAVIGNGATYGYIINVDNQTLPTFTIRSRVEYLLLENSTELHSFNIHRNIGTGTSSVDYSVVGAPDSTHTAADATDFVGGVYPSGTVTFLDGETDKLIYIPIADDATVEADERFDVILSNPVNAIIGIGMDYGYIRNNDL